MRGPGANQSFKVMRLPGLFNGPTFAGLDSLHVKEHTDGNGVSEHLYALLLPLPHRSKYSELNSSQTHLVMPRQKALQLRVCPRNCVRDGVISTLLHVGV